MGVEPTCRLVPDRASGGLRIGLQRALDAGKRPLIDLQKAVNVIVLDNRHNVIAGGALGLRARRENRGILSRRLDRPRAR